MKTSARDMRRATVPLGIYAATSASALAVSLLMASYAASARAQDYSTANAINEAGVIAGGTCLPGCEEFDAFLKGRDGVHLVGTLGGPASLFYGINNRGD